MSSLCVVRGVMNNGQRVSPVSLRHRRRILSTVGFSRCALGIRFLLQMIECATSVRSLEVRDKREEGLEAWQVNRSICYPWRQTS